MAGKRKPPAGRRFKKGQSGNPSGRPSHKDLREWLGVITSPKGGSSRRDNVWQALYSKAINFRDREQVRAIELLLAYDMGKPVQGIQLSGGSGEPGEGGPIQISVLDRLPKMTTGALRRELDDLRKRRSEMTAGRKPPPAKEDAPPAQPDAAPGDSND